MVTATSLRSRSARIFGENRGVPNTISVPVQVNQIGTTRGVPSVHV
jgi:hypothetical protein